MVVDASAIAAVLLVESNAKEVAARIADRKLTAPTLLAFEFANVCSIKARRFPDKIDSLFEALHSFERLAITLLPVDMLGVFELAGRTGLTAYDASYLWLALERNAELVTLDARLGRAYSAAMLG